MLRSVRELEKFRLKTSDGQACGRIKDVYFDDQSWRVLHFVAGLDPRFHGHKQVLLAPGALASFSDDEETIQLNLTGAEMAQAPSASALLPVCKQYSSLAFASPGASFLARGLVASDPHLRSARAVSNYRLNLQGEFAGTLTDFLFDPAEAQIRYLAIEQVIERRRIQFHILPASVARFTWATQRLHLKDLQPVVLESPFGGSDLFTSAA